MQIGCTFISQAHFVITTYSQIVPYETIALQHWPLTGVLRHNLRSGLPRDSNGDFVKKRK